ncbi:MAG: hypothetical protein HKN23_02820 [Verrucomicrobiales bacterium]|nr:hypothetical protein [Verrucomicrobiales bacterium]
MPDKTKNWRADFTHLEEGTILVRVQSVDGAPVSVADAHDLLANDPEFRDFLNQALAESPNAGFFWETPAVSTGTLRDPFQFVLVDGPILLSLSPDPAPFSRQFDTLPETESVAAFPNLSGDAFLIAPAPVSNDLLAYTHLGAFVRNAPAGQIDEFWKTIGQAIQARISETPIWLSTAGLGVSWLHTRIDTRPKYYRHRPFMADPV